MEVASLTFLTTSNLSEWLIFGMFMISGYAYLFFWRTNKKIKKDAIEFDIDILFLSFLFSVLFFIITIGIFSTLNIFYEMKFELISLQSLIYEYGIILAILTLFNHRKAIFNEVPNWFYKNYVKIFPIFMISCFAISFLFIKLMAALLISFFFIFVPFVILIDMTKRCIEGNEM